MKLRLLNLILITLSGCISLASNSLKANEHGRLISWEITNRFSPFELSKNPSETFKKYHIREGESLFNWHKRQWKEFGPSFLSPYAAAIKNNQPTHWDEAAQKHTENFLKFIKEEQSSETKIDISIAYPSQNSCLWEINGNRFHPNSCDMPVKTEIPIKGTTARLQVDGKIIEQHLQPKHLVIIGFGDSYGSGEGNPDVPATWKKGFIPPREETAWLSDKNNLEINGSARWLDERCHRSFFSQQSLTALGIASRSRTTFVSFLHYACTGAEMFDGILTPQFSPGHSSGYNDYSQLNSAIRELCILNTLSYSPADVSGVSKQEFSRLLRVNETSLSPNDMLDKKLKQQRISSAKNVPKSGILNCPPAFMPRKPDIILLSIGGNDIGFGDIVHYYVIPVTYKMNLATNLTFPKICPSKKYAYDEEQNKYAELYCKDMKKKIGYDAGDLIGENTKSGNIRRKYFITFQVIQKYLHVSPSQIYLIQYPDPLRTNKSKIAPCSPLDRSKEPIFGSNRGYNIDSQWNALKVAIPGNIGKTWHFNLLESEARSLLGQFDDLRVQLVAAAKENSINVVCTTRDAFVGHGWWQGTHQALPSHEDKKSQWLPSDWKAYKFESNGRAVRTANDSYLTQAGILNAKHGTAHPNLMGHSLIGDLVLEAIPPAGP